jgi:hypothetical protein
MAKAFGRIVIAVSLVAVGWVAGAAQTERPDFEIVVEAPLGKTVITCKRGCALAWVEKGRIPPPAERRATFDFSCAGPWQNDRCSSYTVGGWVVP